MKIQREENDKINIKERKKMFKRILNNVTREEGKKLEIRIENEKRKRFRLKCKEKKMIK